MARYYDIDTWLHVMSVETQEDYQNLYRSVKRKKTTYMYYVLGLLLFSVLVGFSGNDSVAGFSFFFMFMAACIYPFFYKTYSLCKALEVHDLNAKTSIVLFLVYILCFIAIVPLVLALVIRATNWGMGLSNWNRER